TDWEAIEINPSNLGWENNHAFSLGILNVGINIQDNAMTIPEIKHINFKDSTFQKQAENWFTTPGGFNISSEVNWFAFSLYVKKIGGFAINLTDKIYGHAFTNPTAASLLLEGENSAI